MNVVSHDLRGAENYNVVISIVVWAGKCGIIYGNWLLLLVMVVRETAVAQSIDLHLEVVLEVRTRAVCDSAVALPIGLLIRLRHCHYLRNPLIFPRILSRVWLWALSLWLGSLLPNLVKCCCCWLELPCCPSYLCDVSLKTCLFAVPHVGLQKVYFVTFLFSMRRGLKKSSFLACSSVFASSFL